ncbi:MAG: division/cell wall cluster transcriptional repressor MraZ [Roseovarius sp.]|nr:division/cell wall cluster transcriptional repressor MraZ [Roseovarius sp.]
MGRVFRGESTVKVDAKGRVSIPALFRPVIQECDPSWTAGKQPELVIVYGDHRRDFLECYTIEAIQEVDEKIARLPRGSKQRRLLEHMFQGQSLPTSVDETGRIVLPAKLRKKLDLEDEAFFIAAGDTFQIWKPETYQAKRLADVTEWLDEFPEDFDPLTLLDAPDGG